MGNGLFSAGFNHLEAAVTAREKMQNVYASNIANADTPNYKADTRTFADFLAERQRESGLALTNDSHMQSSSGSSLPGSKSTVYRMDRNTVDIQEEMASMAENQLMHELGMRLLKGKLNGLANVIKEGGR